MSTEYTAYKFTALQAPTHRQHKLLQHQGSDTIPRNFQKMKAQVSPEDTQTHRKTSPPGMANGEGSPKNSPVPSPPAPPSNPSSPSSFERGRNGHGGKSQTNYQSAAAASASAFLKNLPPLFLYMETGDFIRAAERAKRHPREVKAWVNIHVKSSSSASTSNYSSGFGGNNSPSNASTKRLALHQACFKVCLFPVVVLLPFNFFGDEGLSSCLLLIGWDGIIVSFVLHWIVGLLDCDQF